MVGPERPDSLYVLCNFNAVPQTISESDDFLYMIDNIALVRPPGD